MKVVPDADNFARRDHAIGSRCEQRKLHRPPKREVECATAEFHGLAFFIAAWDQAERLRSSPRLVSRPT